MKIADFTKGLLISTISLNLFILMPVFSVWAIDRMVAELKGDSGTAAIMMLLLSLVITLCAFISGKTGKR